MKRLILLLAATAALLGVCPQVKAQGAIRRERIQAVDGRAMGGQTITVCAYSAGDYTDGNYTATAVPCTPAVTIYHDPALTQPITPALQTDNQGNYSYAVLPGNYTECITGPNVPVGARTYGFDPCWQASVGGGGSGSSILLQTNGTNNTVQNILNLAGSVTNSAGTTTISGCAVTSLLDTWVLSIHPNGTCYGSVDWTWDDVAQNMQAGDGSNSVAGSQLTFTEGSGNSVTNMAQAWTRGVDNTLVSDALDDNENWFIDGHNQSITANTAGGPGAGTPLDDLWSDSALAYITVTNGGDIAGITCLIYGCDRTNGASAYQGIQIVGNGSDGDTTSDTDFMVGTANGINATASGASGTNISSMYEIGEFDSGRASAGCNTSDIFFYGELSTVACSTALTADVDSALALGFRISLSSTTHALTDVYAIGETLTGTQSSGSDIDDMFFFGDNITQSNCSHCFAIGENFTNSTSNWIGIGLGATPEIQITPGAVLIPALTVGHCVQVGAGGLLTVAAGACGTSSGTLTATGSPAASELACWSGATSVTNCNLSGDVTTSGTAAATVVKVNGGSVPLSAPVLGSNGSGQPVATSLQGNGAKAQLSTGSTTPNDCVKYDANGNTVDAGAPCSTATSGANTALSNLAAVAINTSLLPGAVNTVDAGSSALPFRNLYVGQSANHAAQLDGSLLTANRLIKYPDEAGTLQLDTDVLGCAQLGTILTGDVTNSNCATTVQKINGITISATAPATGQVTVMTCIGGNTPVCNNANPAQGENSQTGATYLIAPSDLGKIVKRSNSGAMTDTLPDPSTTNFGQGFYFTLSNSGNGATDGGGGIITLSRGSSAVFNIDGNPSITKTSIQIGPRQKCVFVAPDTSNWDVWCSGLPTNFGMQAQKDYTAQASAIGSMGSPITMYTTPASPAGAGYRVTAPLSCDSAVSTATVSFTLNWTDPSGTAQSETSTNAACTTLGSSSYQHIVKDINVQGGTAITFYTTIANAPTYSLHLMLEGAY